MNIKLDWHEMTDGPLPISTRAGLMACVGNTAFCYVIDLGDEFVRLFTARIPRNSEYILMSPNDLLSSAPTTGHAVEWVKSFAEAHANAINDLMMELEAV